MLPELEPVGEWYDDAPMLTAEEIADQDASCRVGPDPGAEVDPNYGRSSPFGQMNGAFREAAGAMNNFANHYRGNLGNSWGSWGNHLVQDAYARQLERGRIVFDTYNSDDLGLRITVPHERRTDWRSTVGHLSCDRNFSTHRAEEISISFEDGVVVEFRGSRFNPRLPHGIVLWPSSQMQALTRQECESVRHILISNGSPPDGNIVMAEPQDRSFLIPQRGDLSMMPSFRHHTLRVQEYRLRWHEPDRETFMIVGG